MQIIRLIAKFPTLAAFAYRHSIGMRYAYPDNDLSFAGNFLNMMWKTTELKYEPDPVLERAMDVLLILHADHEQNCSTTAMRTIGSSDADPYSAAAVPPPRCTAPSTAAPTRPCCACSTEIGSVDKVPEAIEGAKTASSG
jgi:citrate synthase